MPALTSLSITPLQNIVDRSVELTLASFSHVRLKEQNLAISLVSLQDPENMAHFRGEEPIYPASVVKLFYLVACQEWLEIGRIEETPEILRAMKDMIVDSSNDATHYIIDCLTGTTSGPELSTEEMAEWCRRRNLINDFFKKLGYTSINACQKPWGDGPYGRERAFLGAEYENRNILTTNATAKLLASIATGASVSFARSERMMALLQRNHEKLSDNRDDQSTAFIGKALHKGMRLWSKAGWTSTVRHDAACIELASGKRFVLVIFTSNCSKQVEIIPTMARLILSRLE